MNHTEIFFGDQTTKNLHYYYCPNTWSFTQCARRQYTHTDNNYKNIVYITYKYMTL